MIKHTATKKMQSINLRVDLADSWPKLARRMVFQALVGKMVFLAPKHQPYRRSYRFWYSRDENKFVGTTKGRKFSGFNGDQVAMGVLMGWKDLS